MALTINPAVSGTNARTWLQTACFAAGVVIGSSLSAIAVLLLGNALVTVVGPIWVSRALAAVLVWGVVHDLGVPLPMPYRPRQVPERLRDYLPGEVVAAYFGLELGIGFVTLFTYAAQAAFLPTFLFLQSTTQVASVIAVFALAKSLVVLGGRGVESLDEVTPRFRWSRAEDWALRSASAAATTLVVLALVSSASP